jgi:hypothetical protein
MAEVIHRYVGRGDAAAAPRELSKSEQEREQLDAEWRRKRIAAESAKQRLHEAKMLSMRGELISRQHVTRQATFLLIALRQRLLAIAAQHARELLNIADEREMALRLDAIVRSSLDEIAQMPLRVSDERWLERLEEPDELEATPAKRPRRAAK